MFKNSFVSVVLFSLLLAGCSFFNEPVREFFMDYTETAVVLSHEFDGNFPIGKDGIPMIPSGRDHEIRLTLRNPQHYIFPQMMEFGNVRTDGTVYSGPEPVVVQNMADPTYMTIMINNDYLVAMEGGGIFSPKVRLVETKSGREFTPYSIPLKVNSAPPAPSNAVVMIDKTKSPMEYIVCFDFPNKKVIDSDSIHHDIETLEITSSTGYSKSYSVSDSTLFIASDGKISFDGGGALVIVSGPHITTTAPPSSVLQANDNFGASGFVHTPHTDQSAYFFSEDQISPENIIYTLSFIDTCGLKSSFVASVQSEKLCSVTAEAETSLTDYGDGGAFTVEPVPQNDDGSAYVSLYGPSSKYRMVPDLDADGNQQFDGSGALITKKEYTSVSDVTVDYQIYSGSVVSSANLIGDGSFSGSKMISIPFGECTIVAVARKYLNVDSDPAIFHVKPVVSRIFVDNINGLDDPGYGSKTLPCKTVANALTLLDDSTASANHNIIYLTNDYEDAISISGGAVVTLAGYGATRTIRNSGATALTVSGSATEVMLKSIGITGSGLNSTVAAVSVQSGALFTENVNIYDNTGYGISYNASSSPAEIHLGNNTYITGNSGGMIGMSPSYSGSCVFVKDNVFIYNNKDASDKQHNFIINTNKSASGDLSSRTIGIEGPLASTSKIGVTLEDNVPSISHPDVITEGFTSVMGSVNARKYFVSDSVDYAVSAQLEGGEAKLIVGGGALNVKSPKLKFKISSAGMTCLSDVYYIHYAKGQSVGSSISVVTEIENPVEGEVAANYTASISLGLDTLNVPVVASGSGKTVQIPGNKADYGNFDLTVTADYAGSKFTDTFSIKLLPGYAATMENFSDVLEAIPVGSMSAPNSILVLHDGTAASWDTLCSTVNTKRKYVSFDLTRSGMTSLSLDGLSEISYVVEVNASGITSLSNRAFCRLTSLKKVELDGSLTSIPMYAFYLCSSLEEIVLPEHITEINRNAFYGSGLRTIRIPDDVAKIDVGCFGGCVNLTEVEFSQMDEWKVNTTPQTNISPSDLSDRQNAAVLLKTTYTDNVWTR